MIKKTRICYTDRKQFGIMSTSNKERKAQGCLGYEGMKDKYAIYFTWNDGFDDSFNVYDAKERDMNIKEMIDRKDFKYISYCRIYANGEYGKRKEVII